MHSLGFIFDRVKLIRSHEEGLAASKGGDPPKPSVRLCDGRTRECHAGSHDALACAIRQVELLEDHERRAPFDGLTLLGSIVRCGADSEVLNCANSRPHGRHNSKDAAALAIFKAVPRTPFGIGVSTNLKVEIAGPFLS